MHTGTSGEAGLEGSWGGGISALLRCPVCALATVRLRCTPTAATRSARFLCRRQRSHRSPPQPASLVSFLPGQERYPPEEPAPADLHKSYKTTRCRQTCCGADCQILMLYRAIDTRRRMLLNPRQCRNRRGYPCCRPGAGTWQRGRRSPVCGSAPGCIPML